jgi:hypothetical protein
MDERIVQRLEEQLRDAHVTNAELRDRLGDVKKREQTANAIRAEGEISNGSSSRLMPNRRPQRTTRWLLSARAQRPNAARSVPRERSRSYVLGLRECRTKPRR